MEFGYKAQVVDNVDGIVLDHSVHLGNPPDAPLLAPAIDRIQTLFGRVVRAVTADRGYGEAKIEQELRDLGVKTVVIPRKGKPGQARRELEHGRGFRRLVKWRTGSEGRISYLKRRYGWDRTLFDTLAGAQTWCGLGVLAHNSVKIAHLIQANQPQPTPSARPGRPRPARPSAPDPAATGPPPDPLFHHAPPDPHSRSIRHARSFREDVVGRDGEHQHGGADRQPGPVRRRVRTDDRRGEQAAGEEDVQVHQDVQHGLSVLAAYRPVRYSTHSPPTFSVAATAGWVSATTPGCRSTLDSRRARRTGRARSARVTGAASTSSSGPSMPSRT